MNARMEDSDWTLGRVFFGLGMILCLLFLVLALMSHSPNDPPQELLILGGGSADIQNLCGRMGALISAFFFDFCGIGVWLVCGFCALVILRYFRAMPSVTPILKIVGYFSILAAVSGLASVFFPDETAGGVYGVGGWLGAMIRTGLGTWTSPLGCVTSLLGMLLAGIILAVETVPQASEQSGQTAVPVTDEKEPAAASGLMSNERSVLNALNLISARKPEELNPIEAKPEDRKQEEPKGVPYPLSSEGDIEGLTERLTEDGAGDDTEDDAGNDTEIDTKGDTEGVTEDNTEGNTEGNTKGNTKEKSADQFPDDTQSFGEDKGVLEINSPGTELSNEAVAPPEEPPYRLPSIDLLDRAQERDFDEMREQILDTGRQVEKAFAEYDIQVKVVEMQSGPILTLYEIALQKGTRLSQIRTLHQDLAIRLKVPSVRIVAPIPGKNTVGIEVPHHQRQMVHLSEVMEEGSSQIDKMAIPLFLGKDVSGDPMVADLAKLPHLLIAGRTGTGKSVCLNAIILSILMTRTPEEVRLLLIDPKVVEFTLYESIPHLYYPVVTDMKKAEAILEWAVDKMEKRYKILARAGVRQLSEYNRYTPEQLRMRMRPASEDEWATIPKKLASIVIIADEIGDLMAVAGKDVQGHIIRLAQKSRAVGIHLILATQKPTVDVITGQIKSNLPARIAFGVTNLTDSRVVLDERGAEQLLGNGDMLFLLPGTSHLVRGQGTFVSNEEVETIVREVSDRQQNFEAELFSVGNGDEGGRPDRTAELLQRKDDLYDEAVEFLIQEGRGSTSILQRRFNIGYGRAARIIDTMAAEKIVGPYKGSQARDIIITLDQWRASQGGTASPSVSERQPVSERPVSAPRGTGAAAPSRREGRQRPAEPLELPGPVSFAGGIRQVDPKKMHFIKEIPEEEEEPELDEEYTDEEYDNEYSDEEEYDESEEYTDEEYEDEEYEDDEYEEDGDFEQDEGYDDEEYTDKGYDDNDHAGEAFVEDPATSSQVPKPNLRMLAQRRKFNRPRTGSSPSRNVDSAESAPPQRPNRVEKPESNGSPKARRRRRRR